MKSRCQSGSAESWAASSRCPRVPAARIGAVDSGAFDGSEAASPTPKDRAAAASQPSRLQRRVRRRIGIESSTRVGSADDEDALDALDSRDAETDEIEAFAGPTGARIPPHGLGTRRRDAAEQVRHAASAHVEHVYFSGSRERLAE